MSCITPLLKDISNGNPLSSEQVEEAFDLMLAGKLSPAQSGALLAALHTRGETAEELAAAVKAALGQAVQVRTIKGKCIDTCGTGGDGKKSFNCSTAVALFLADMGYQVVKHGNRAVSSHCGSADVIEFLGLPLADTPEQVVEELDKRNFAFLFAPNFHPAFKHVAPIRRELGIRTLFNLMGPLLNPARPTHQIIGVPDFSFAPMMAQVLAGQGLEKGIVVHGAKGFDELTPCGISKVIFVQNGSVREGEVNSEELGLPLCSEDDLVCPTKDQALDAQRLVLAGRGSKALQAMVAINLGMALHLLEDDLSLQQGIDQAREKVAKGLKKGAANA